MAERLKFATIKQTALIDASPLEVYEAYVNPKKHAAFTGQVATGTPKVGGRFTAGDGYSRGKYLELEKGKRILHEWKTTEWPEGYPPSLLELTLKAKGRKTELTMVQSKVPEEQVEYYAEGWKEYYWEPLKKYFAKKAKWPRALPSAPAAARRTGSRPGSGWAGRKQAGR